MAWVRPGRCGRFPAPGLLRGAGPTCGKSLSSPARALPDALGDPGWAVRECRSAQALLLREAPRRGRSPAAHAAPRGSEAAGPRAWRGHRGHTLARTHSLRWLAFRWRRWSRTPRLRVRACSWYPCPAPTPYFSQRRPKQRMAPGDPLVWGFVGEQGGYL